MDLVWVAALTPRESRMGRSASPLAAFAFLGLAPSCVTESTSLVRFLFSSSSATSTRSATSSPKSPTCESELTDRVVAFWRLRSTLERGTREQVLLDLGAGFHAGEFAFGEGALHVALAAAELLGSLPSSCASSCVVAKRISSQSASAGDWSVENTGVFRLDPSVASSKNVHPLIGKTPLMAFERYPAQGLVRFVYAMGPRPVASHLHGKRRSRKRMAIEGKQTARGNETKRQEDDPRCAP